MQAGQVRSLLLVPALPMYWPGVQTLHATHALWFVELVKVPLVQPVQLRSLVVVPAALT